MTTLREAAQQFVADYDCGGCGHFAAYAENFRKALAQEEPRRTGLPHCERGCEIRRLKAELAAERNRLADALDHQASIMSDYFVTGWVKDMAKELRRSKT